MTAVINISCAHVDHCESVANVYFLERTTNQTKDSCAHCANQIINREIARKTVNLFANIFHCQL